MSLAQTLRYIWAHPLTRDDRVRSTLDYLRWQVGSRLVPGPVVVPFVGDTRLVVEPGMTGATGNVYVGLHELEDMAFALHFLRPGDLFADVGANVGSYTVLASGAVGAHTVAFEPIPETYARLARNIAINGLGSRAEARPVGVGAEPGRLRFTADRDAANRAITDAADASGPTVEVEIVTLDAAFADRTPILCKIDVEGLEAAVLEGAAALLDRPDLQALLVELAPGRAYDVATVHRDLLGRGFVAATYAPLDGRVLRPSTGPSRGHANALYVRDLAAARARLAAAPRYRVRRLLV